MKKTKDIRIIILEGINSLNIGTEELKANEFLATTHKDDLGTIKRALIDLLNDGYIRESNVAWAREKEKSVIFNIDTQGSAGDPKKDPKRLLDQNDIKFIRLYITLKGKRFLIEEENLRRTTRSIKYDIPIKLAFMVLGFLLTIAGYYLNTFLPKNKSERQETVQQATLSDISLENQADSTNSVVD